MYCNGCKNFEKWENEIELGLPSPCTRCARRAPDNFEPEYDIPESTIDEKLDEINSILDSL